ncbi:hypothetical protein NUW54_g12733 [Trametes sanguinea]|uniref:Uncharacterized protein n=1 Tax=Trametes sanguinea TaxID=158606 RepID=A0ACC1MTU3_9APHY|nr:hypothetical protein NUW54_g12733 [Trametes sanguinea]
MMSVHSTRYKAVYHWHAYLHMGIRVTCFPILRGLCKGSPSIDHPASQDHMQTRLPDLLELDRSVGTQDAALAASVASGSDGTTLIDVISVLAPVWSGSMWRSAWSLIPTLILLWPRQVYAANFTFTYGTATQCDDFSVSWTGGTPPFQLTLALPYGSYRTLDIPADNYSNGKGSFTATLPFAAAKQFMAIMSDSTGFATGGVSKLITVGKPSGQNSCNTTDPGVDFTFETNSFLGQCLTYTFDHYEGAVQPFTVTGIIPGGTVFPLTAPVGSASFDWVGGMVVAVKCSPSASQTTRPASRKTLPPLLAHPPTQTKPATSKPSASKTQSGTASTSATASATAAPDDGSSSKTSGGTIAGAIIGCLIGAFVVGTLIWFYLRRRRGTSLLSTGKVGGFFGKFQKKEVDLMHDPGLPPPAAAQPVPSVPPARRLAR